MEGTINEKLEDIARRIENEKPWVIGFSLYIWNRKQTLTLINIVKNILPDTKIVVGGPEASYDVCNILTDNICIDYVISGEGERPIAELLDALLCEKNIPESFGISYRRENGELVLDEPFITCEDPPSPYEKDYIDSVKGRIAYLESSRGCPYNCAYCLSGRCGGVRFFDLDTVKKNILLLANSGAKTIKFVDRTFNANKTRAREIFGFIISNYKLTIPEGVCFHFEIAADILDALTIELLNSAPAGLIQLEIGIQSYNEQTLEFVNRKTDVDLLDDNIKGILKSKNIHTHIDLIAGLPKEDFDSFCKGFNRAYSLGADMLQLGFLKLLHGSPMREKSQKYICEYSKEPPYEVISTPYMTCGELATLHIVEEALDRLYNSGRFRRTLDYALRKISCTPFDLFLKIGNYISAEAKNAISLDEYTNLIFRFLSKKCDASELRDMMILDRFETCRSTFIPKELRVSDKKLALVKKALEKQEQHKSKKEVQRGVAILYSRRSVAYVDFCDSNVSIDKYCRFIVKELPLSLFEN